MNSPSVTTELFGMASCPFTDDLREDLYWRGLDFIEYDVEHDVQARSRLLALTRGQRTVPVLVENGVVTQIGVSGRGCTL